MQVKALGKGLFTSDGATCPETLSTSELVQVKEDQCVTENCDIRYTSCFDVAQTKFLNCISIKKKKRGNISQASKIVSLQSL
jgi:hypothetical protein